MPLVHVGSVGTSLVVVGNTASGSGLDGSGFLPFGPFGGQTDPYGWALGPPGGRSAYGSAMGKGGFVGPTGPGPAYTQLPASAYEGYTAAPSLYGQKASTYRVAAAVRQLSGRLKAMGKVASTDTYRGARGVWVGAEDALVAQRLAETIGPREGLHPVRFKLDDEVFVGYRVPGAFPDRWF